MQEVREHSVPDIVYKETQECGERGEGHADGKGEKADGAADDVSPAKA